MNNITLRAPLAMALLAGVVAACSNPVSEEDHADPDGIVIRAGATEMVRVEGIGPTAEVTGALSIEAGAQTPVLTVTFIDHDGDDLTLELDEFWLEVVSSNSATATWQGTEAGSFTGRVSGLTAGAATLSFLLYHGAVGGGHPEEGGGPYVVPVTVTATQQ